MAASTSGVYVSVIEDVINKVREEFLNNGPGEDVLKELQGTWEAKTVQAGVVNNPIERSAAKGTPGSGVTPVHDLNVPYEGTEEYETPTAEMLFPPTPLQTPIPATPIPTPLPGAGDNMYNIPTGGSEYSANESGSSNGGVNAELKAGRSGPYMQPPSTWMNHRPPLDVNIAYVEGRDEADRGASHQPPTQDFFQMNSGKRKREDFPAQYQAGGYLPQQDGAGDAAPEIFEIEVSEGSSSIASRAWSEMLTRVRSSTLKIPQLDGPIPDPYDELSTPNIYNYQGAFNEDYNVASTPAPHDIPVSTPAPVVQNDVGDDDDDEPPLNENDDDELDDVDQGDELNTAHLVLAQFDKVTRTKSRWKCTLKDGIMHINNKDILFNKATGEFEF
ncbi:transcription initiation factor IIA large subunit-like isoform X1 [Malus sylvestris]|uniref:transcription initiation factor IIA large subunit-like isoform X1 n=1 Tax=Malus sylvestris TaxID=3752 RepID=UPI0021ACBD2F|nr:transcription initiation factor IIA large subunit-like isoform X1 [Malus sylvestris]